MTSSELTDTDGPGPTRAFVLHPDIRADRDRRPAGPALEEAVARAYRAVARIEWPGGFNRSDIGARALKRD